MKGQAVIVLTGPTASGKSAIANSVAESLSSEIVSCDSMQIYKHMDIGTAKVPPQQRSVPYHMLDVVEPTEEYSAARFQNAARDAIDSILAKGSVPIICGGTGFYLDAIIDDMHFIKPNPTYQKMLEEKGGEALYTELQKRDPQSANLLSPHNIKRVIRALEAWDAGTPYYQRTEELKRRAPWYQATQFVLMWSRNVLYERIEKRVEEMFSLGFVEEVKDLLDRYHTLSTTASQAIGYKQFLAYFEGRYTLVEAKEEIKKATRRYAKRQLSWIKRDGRATVLDMTTLTAKQAQARIIEAAHVLQ